MGRYSAILMDHFQNPRNNSRLEAADGLGLVGTPGDGPFLLLGIHVSEGRVRQARFQTHGCGASIAAGSMLTVMAIGRSLEDCLVLSAEELTAALDGVPPDKAHCPAMAVAALRLAIEDYRRRSEAGRSLPAPSARSAGEG